MKVGIDIGGSHISIGLVEDGKIIQKLEQDIQNYDDIQEFLVNYVDKGLEKFSEIADISSIGIAAPGNPDGCTIFNLVNLGIEKVDFGFIEEKYHLKIKSINDGKASGLAEKKYGAMREFRDSVFLCLGTGIGGAVFLNDQLLLANRNPGFELGHMIIEKNGKQCKCGKKGCFETYCSMKRFKENVVQILQEIGVLVSVEDASNIVVQLKANIENPKLNQLVENYINDMIIGLSNIIDIFEPEGIVLGGSFVYFKDILYNRLIDEMSQRRYVFNHNYLPKIELAELQNDAGLIGATLI